VKRPESIKGLYNVACKTADIIAVYVYIFIHQIMVATKKEKEKKKKT